MKTKMDTLKSDNVLAILTLFLAVALVFVPEHAFAQVQGQGILDYAIEQYGKTLVNGGILVGAGTMLLARFDPRLVATVAGGGLTFANYQEIAGLFGA